jgi:membrane protein implicated in regulation of membrane protease activity
MVDTPALGWLGLGFGLLVVEMLSGTLFCFWLSMAAFITGLLTWVLGPGGPIQVAIFAVAVLASVAGWQHFRPRKLEAGRDPLPLNSRPASYIGRQVVLQEAIVQGRGRVNIDDSWWQVHGADLPAGTLVKVDSVEEMVLRISKCP